eukprot:m.42426 g.42426  ORF g.42426 m.42426 type:complete len:369 (-) comp12879_c0_seq1:229-1335(-)
MPRTFSPAISHPVETMRAVVYGHYGDSDVLQLQQDHPQPKRSADHILVKVVASTVNPVDVKLRRFPTWNMVNPKPKIPGCDIAGIVTQVPYGCHFKVGDPVMAFLPLLGSVWGSAAEYVSLLPTVAVQAPVSEHCTLAECATFPLVGSTVIQGFAPVIKAWNGETQGKRVLIQAGSGGVGTFAIQYCKNVLGMYVATTCSSGSVELVKELGADQVIDYTQDDFTKVIKDFDCVLDPLPYAYEEKTMSSTVLKARGSHYIHIASSSPNLNPGDAGTDGLGAAIPEARLGNMLSLGFKHLKSWFSHVKFHSVFVYPDQETLHKVAEAVACGKVKPIVDREYQLAELAAAHDYVGQGHCHGKVLVHNVKQD